MAPVVGGAHLIDRAALVEVVDVAIAAVTQNLADFLRRQDAMMVIAVAVVPTVAVVVVPTVAVVIAPTVAGPCVAIAVGIDGGGVAGFDGEAAAVAADVEGE